MKTLLILIAFILTTVTAAISPTSLISVRGEGSVTRPPDTAIVTMGVTCEGKTAREALTKNNQDMERILTELKGLGLQDRDLQTSGFRLYPKYNQNASYNNKVVGYTVSNDLTMKIRDIDSTGKILDQAVSLGINNVMNGITFTHSNPQGALQEARRAAVQDARVKAETMVQELGVRLGSIASIAEGHTANPAVGRSRNMQTMAMESSSVPMASGENSYLVTVDIRWEIDQEGSSSSSSCQTDN